MHNDATLETASCRRDPPGALEFFKRIETANRSVLVVPEIGKPYHIDRRWLGAHLLFRVRHMSRAYRISVSESLQRVIRAEDHVSTRLEILEILPCDQMADLLAIELEKEGYEREGDLMTKDLDGTRVSVDVKTGEVVVRRESDQSVEVSGSKSGNAYDDVGPSSSKIRENLKNQLDKQLEGQVSEKEQQLQKEVTDALEAELSDLRKELDQVVNRATAAALKQKASSLGQIKELTEDPETGSMTIVLEV